MVPEQVAELIMKKSFFGHQKEAVSARD
jgi:hypothetical protein